MAAAKFEKPHILPITFMAGRCWERRDGSGEVRWGLDGNVGKGIAVLSLVNDKL